MGDKSEEPTQKKVRDAKQKGQVANSRDMTSAFTFMVSFTLLVALGGGISGSLQENMKQYLTWATTLHDVPPAAYGQMLQDQVFLILKLVAPLLWAVFAIALAICYVQVGFIFTFEQIKPDLKKINPLAGIKKWFSPKTLIEMLKSVIKMVAVLALAYMVVKDELRYMVLSVGQRMENMNIFLSDMVWGFAKRVGVVFAVIAAADFVYQKKSHHDQLKMSKDEVKREYKEDEGDPMFKHKRKELAHELVFNNMMKSARKATAVVVNPTHYAAAIFYDREKGGAPSVLAKGQNLIAEQLKTIAKEEKIPIIRNITLAQALNRVELGSEIPEELYQAVAEVLNFVYKLGQQQRRR